MHMEPVTREENSRRGERNRLTRRSGGGARMAARTHCKNGHPFTPENTRMQGTARICKPCSRERLRRFRAREREQ
jgi:hypothetical protein